jgi:quinol monooxygenase YgiN
MIMRIVKMTFTPGKVNEFLQLFSEVKTKISSFKGCNHLELLKDTKASNIFFTYSIWDDEKLLDHYRFSELFKDTWLKTKLLFREKAEAWSLVGSGQLTVNSNQLPVILSWWAFHFTLSGKYFFIKFLYSCVERMLTRSVST